MLYRIEKLAPSQIREIYTGPAVRHFPADERKPVAAIEKLLDKEARESMKDNCINKAKQFDMTVSHKQRYDIYKEILG